MAISSFCSNSNGCVDVTFDELTGMVIVSDTKMIRTKLGRRKRQTTKLYFTVQEWEAFIEGAKNGEFDLPHDTATAVTV